MRQHLPRTQLLYVCRWVPLLFLILLFTGMVQARAHSDQLLDTPVSVRLEQVTLKDALVALEGIARVRFFYSSDVVDVTEVISLRVHQKPLREVLEHILVPLRITYNVHEKEGVITLRRQLSRTGQSTLPVDGSRLPEREVITGRVTEAGSGRVMPGVNILIKGTAEGTTTDGEGKYSLMAELNAVLVFSFIGYTTQEVPVSGRLVIDVAMEEDVVRLGDVVVNAGYWQVTDRERTGSISRVTAETIGQQPVNNPLQALQGRMAGVQVTQTTGLPGGGFTVRVRGINSLRADANEPFYVVDGVPFVSQSLSYFAASGGILQQPNPLATINPSDIESIEVLKDADATAIYGSRGANGVILITTKKSKVGKTSVSGTVWHGVGRVGSRMEVLNSAQYVAMRKEGMQHDGYGPATPNIQSLAPDLYMWDTTRYTDWQRVLLGGSARMTSAQVSVSGGSAATTFTFRGGYYRETTVFPGEFDNVKGSGHLHVEHRSEDDKFRLWLTTTYLRDDNKLLSEDLTRHALTLPPVAPSAFDEQGNLNWGPTSQSTWDNPYSKLDRPYQGQSSNLNFNVTARYALAEGLELKTSLGINDISMDEFNTTPLRSLNVYHGNTTTFSVFTDNRVRTWIAEPQVRYTAMLLPGLKTDLLVGSTFQESIQEGGVLFADGYTSDALLRNRLSAAQHYVLQSDYNQYRYQAWFGRLNFTYSGKYILNLTARRDGSSRFGAGRRFGNFGAVGVAWLFTEEGFLRDSRWLSFGKLRMSYGTTGSDQVGHYAYLSTYSPTAYPYNGVRGILPDRHTNPFYGWETNTKAEAALETGFLKDRIMVGVAWFRNRSSNQLVQFPLPATTGFGSVTQNMPATVENSGFEAEVSAVVVDRGKLRWTTSFNLTIPRNKLVEYEGIERSPYANIYQVGKSLNTRKRYQFKGLDPQTGLYTFYDFDENGRTNSPGDLIALKEVGQHYYGGLQQTLTYRNISLQVFFQYVKQTATSQHAGFSVVPGGRSNQPASVLDRWQVPGDEGGVQRYVFFYTPASQAYGFYGSSDDRFTDASFIRLKNLSLQYSLPSGVLQKVGVTNCSLQVQGQNIFTRVLSKEFVGLDPETGSNVLPPLRVLTVGLNVTL